MLRLSLNRTKLFVVLVVLEIFLVLDFLGEIPRKTLRRFLELGLICIFAIGLSMLLGNWSQSRTLHLTLRQLLYPYQNTLFFNQIPRPFSPDMVKPFPTLSASAVYVYDLRHGKLLKDINANVPYPPASTTKLMTALIARNLYALDYILFVDDTCTKIDTQRAGFTAGEGISVYDLLGTLLVNSSGDAACALSYGDGSYTSFISAMNAHAAKIGMINTHFTNPIGLDDSENTHVSTARDLFLLSLAASKDPVLADFVSSVAFTTSSSTFPRTFINTNRLLTEIPGTVGVKTGRTEAAGEVLIYEYKSDGLHFISVVMGSLDRFGDTKQILSWVQDVYGRK